jgi:hypothetical protein
MLGIFNKVIRILRIIILFTFLYIKHIMFLVKGIVNRLLVFHIDLIFLGYFSTVIHYFIYYYSF